MEIPEGEERKKVTKEIFETKRTENFSQLISDSKSQIQEAQRRLMRRNIENYTEAYHFTKKRKSKRKNPERSQNKSNALGIEEQRAECHISSP